MLLIPIPFEPNERDCNEKLIYLSSGCLRYSQRETWVNQSRICLVSPLENPEKAEQARQYVNETYEKVLVIMSEVLNEIHHEYRSLRYWRVVLGAWLSFFLECFYERYCSVSDALMHYPNIESIGIASSQKEIPQNYQEFSTWSQSDSYNLQIYTDIFDFLDISYSEVFLDQAARPRFVLQPSNEDCTLLERSTFNGIAFVLSYFSQYAEALFIQKSNIPIISLWPLNYATPILSINYDIRNRIAAHLRKTLSGKPFDSLIAEVLSQHIPVCHVEAYNQIKTISSHRFPFIPQAILSAVSWLVDEPFKLWAAECAEAGTALLSAQHGGMSMGITCSETHQQHLIDLADKYYSWGWHDTKLTKVIPMPAQKLCGRPTYHPISQTSNILYVCTNRPRYFNSLSGATMFDFENMIAKGVCFALSLTKNIQKELRVRMHHEDSGWDVLQRWKDDAAEIVVETMKIPLGERLLNCRMMVSDNLQTTFFEALAMNIPIILFLDRRQISKTRDSAEWFFEEMLSVGILHYSPESAAQLINTNYHRIYDWWQEPLRQHVRRKICETFCRTSYSWIEEWSRELNLVFHKNAGLDEESLALSLIDPDQQALAAVGNKNRIVIFGANHLGLAVASSFSYCSIVGFGDSDPARQGQAFSGLKIRAINDLLQEKPDAFLIAEPSHGHRIKEHLHPLANQGIAIVNVLTDLPENISRSLFAQAYGWGRVFKG